MAPSTAEQSLQNWIWREALCVSLLLMQTGVELLATEVVAPGWHLFPAAPTAAPKVLLH